jgi:hypothetical protein
MTEPRQRPDDPAGATNRVGAPLPRAPARFDSPRPAPAPSFGSCSGSAGTRVPRALGVLVPFVLRVHPC